MRILTICPTKNRAAMCRDMVKSFMNTINEDNTIVLGIDISDEQIVDYQDIKEANKILCKANSTVTEVINSIYKSYPDYDFYHITNDDALYLTKAWDTKFLSIHDAYGSGIFYGNDLLQGKNLPTFPFISADIVKSAGWLQLPTLNRYCGDIVWKFIGERLRCLYYLDGVIIKHNWDGNVNKDINVSDMQEFAKFLQHSEEIISRIKRSI